LFSLGLVLWFLLADDVPDHGSAAVVLLNVQATDALDGENWQAATTVISQSDEGSYWQITVRDTVPLAVRPHRFMRLQVTH
jgi:hypothetical protein